MARPVEREVEEREMVGGGWGGREEAVQELVAPDGCDDGEGSGVDGGRGGGMMMLPAPL